MFSGRFWNDQMMNWAMKDPAFKVQLFRFIDVFPMLRTPALVHDYLTDYLSQPGVTLPPGMDLGLKAGGLAKGLMAKTIAGRITSMAGNFMAGVDATTALPVLEKLWDEGVAFTVDLLGEACLEPGGGSRLPAPLSRSASKLCPARLRAGSPIRSWRPTISARCRARTSRSSSARFAPGPIRSTPSACCGCSLSRCGRSWKRRRKNKVMIAFDMEQAALKDMTLTLFEHCCEAIDFPATLAVQSYLRSGMDDIAAGHRLGPPQRPANHRAADQGRLLGL